MFDERIYELVCSGNIMVPNNWPQHDVPPTYMTRKQREEYELYRDTYMHAARSSTPFIIDEAVDEWMTTSIEPKDMRIALPFSNFWLEYQYEDNQYAALCQNIPANEVGDVVSSVDEDKILNMAGEGGRVLVFVTILQFGDEPARAYDRVGVVPITRHGEPRFCNDLALLDDVHTGHDCVNIFLFAMGLLSSSSGPTIDVRARSCLAGQLAEKEVSTIRKVLKVQPSRHRLHYIDSRATGDRKRHHAVRGHFRHYTEKRPLFGKFVGQVYVRGHCRGDKRLGSVVKCYDLQI